MRTFRRVANWLATGVVLILAILAVATSCSWSRSYFARDTFGRFWKQEEPRAMWRGVHSLVVGRGCVLFSTLTDRNQTYTHPVNGNMILDPWAYRCKPVVKIANPRFDYAEFIPCWASEYKAQRFGELTYESWDRTVSIPHWILLLLFGTCPVVTLVRWWRRRQRSARGFAVIEKEQA
ncbi:MAG TPA: hypothetical protein VH475_21460 [Tepidisphaeraceae bacterium]|jgi:hypothetical protein